MKREAMEALLGKWLHAGRPGATITVGIRAQKLVSSELLDCQPPDAAVA
ncbi:MAG: hypothetical protein ACT4NU_02480 [Chromatiales bacterium]